MSAGIKEFPPKRVRKLLGSMTLCVGPMTAEQTPVAAERSDPRKSQPSAGCH